jgi:hypothetical protein
MMNPDRILWLGLIGALALSCAKATSNEHRVAEQKEVTITCELTQAPKWSDVPIFESANDCQAATGTYHYVLWLPKGYLADTQRRWPCMFIADAEGHAKMGNMAAWLKARGYIVVMLVESKNGPWPVIVGNFLAAHDDVVQRVRIQEGLKFATGVSGGARASSVFVQIRPGFSGLILQGAGLAYKANSVYVVAGLRRTPPIYVAMTMGDRDKNRVEVEEMRRWIGSSHFQAFEFQGGHGWAPAEVFERAITWVEEKVRDAAAEPQSPQKVN